MKSSSSTTCPNCDRAVRGRYCAHCGATTEAAACVSCDAPLEPGDRHCSQCGESASGSPRLARARQSQRTAWIVAGIAFVALALMVVLQKASDMRARDAAAVADAGSVQAGAPAPGGGSRISAQELASMTPRELMDRLYNKIMTLHEAGKTDSVSFFAPMFMSIYERPEVQPADADLRYHVGTVAYAAGMPDVEKAQADTVLSAAPDHLLGLLMAARNARARGAETEAKRFEKRLLDAESRERAKQLPEYRDHQSELDDALRRARGQ